MSNVDGARAIDRARNEVLREATSTVNEVCEASASNCIGCPVSQLCQAVLNLSAALAWSNLTGDATAERPVGGVSAVDREGRARWVPLYLGAETEQGDGEEVGDA